MPGSAPGALPLLSDGTIWQVLERLLVLDGERLSYRRSMSRRSARFIRR